MDPFVYPDLPHTRRHGPRGYADIASYRSWLRDEYSFRCVYCLVGEQWGRVRGTFDIDHFLPLTSHPEHGLTYDNLLYGCATCNSAKGMWLVPNPETALIARAVQVHEDGTIAGHTPAARRLIRVLGLDDPEYTEFRLLWQGIMLLAKQYQPDLYGKLMAFPNDLPNLARLRPPGGNSRPEGIQQSFFARRRRFRMPTDGACTQARCRPDR